MLVRTVRPVYIYIHIYAHERLCNKKIHTTHLCTAVRSSVCVCVLCDLFTSRALSGRQAGGSVTAAPGAWRRTCLSSYNTYLVAVVKQSPGDWWDPRPAPIVVLPSDRFPTCVPLPTPPPPPPPPSRDDMYYYTFCSYTR